MIVAAGLGVSKIMDKVKNFADKYGAELGASRAAVDADVLPYEKQIGLTGKSVSPAVYVAVGISGAVHHIEGMKRSGTVIAINKDKDAPIFEYADYGVIGDFNEII
jgi:electron transfer flavoprotein alpha subunit